MDDDLLKDEDDEKQVAIKSYLAAKNAPPPQMDVADNATPPAQEDEAAASAAAAPAVAPADKIKAALARQYAQASDTSGVNDAVQRSADINQTADVGHALETLARSNSMAHGGAGVDNNYWQGMKQEGQQGIQHAQQGRQMALASFLQGNEIHRQVAQDMMAKGTFDQQQKAAKYLNDQNDPTSATSKNAQQAFGQIFKDYPGIADMNVDGFSASDLTSASKNADVVAKLKEMAQAKEMQIAYQQNTQKEKQDQTKQQNAVRDLAALAKDVDTQGATTHTNLGQAQNKINSATRLMTFADVTPEEIEAAKKDPAAKAALIQKMNKLTPQQYTEVVSGLMSQIQSGQGSFGQLEHMRANTADQTAANIAQFFSSNPTPANVGGMITNNLLTLKNEQDTSQAILDKHHTQLRAKHPLAFSHDDTKGNAENMLSSFANNDQPSAVAAAKGPAQQSPQAMLAAALPQDPKELVAGKSYKLKNGKIGTFNGKGFTPLVEQPQTAMAQGQ